MHRSWRPAAAEVVDRLDNLLRHPSWFEDQERYADSENENPGAGVDVPHASPYSVFLTVSALVPSFSISLK